MCKHWTFFGSFSHGMSNVNVWPIIWTRRKKENEDNFLCWMVWLDSWVDLIISQITNNLRECICIIANGTIMASGPSLMPDEYLEFNLIFHSKILFLNLFSPKNGKIENFFRNIKDQQSFIPAANHYKYRIGQIFVCAVLHTTGIFLSTFHFYKHNRILVQTLVPGFITKSASSFSILLLSDNWN